MSAASGGIPSPGSNLHGSAEEGLVRSRRARRVGVPCPVPDELPARLEASDDLSQRFVGSRWRPHHDRPTVTTPDPGLVLAGDLVRTDLPVALMERAATAGLLAANTLLHLGALVGAATDADEHSGRSWICCDEQRDEAARRNGLSAGKDVDQHRLMTTGKGHAVQAPPARLSTARAPPTAAHRSARRP